MLPAYRVVPRVSVTCEFVCPHQSNSCGLLSKYSVQASVLSSISLDERMY